MRASPLLPVLFAALALGCDADSAVTPADKFDPIKVQGDFIIAPDTSLLVVGGGRRLGVEDLSQLYALSFGRADWSSSNRSVATVDGAGYVHAVGEGTTTITAVVNGHRASAPVLVQRYPAPLHFTQVSMGVDHVCGVTDAGTIYCWGSSISGGYASGQLGTTKPMDACEGYYNGSTGFRRSTARCSAVPVRVESDEHFVSVEVRDYGTCGLTSAGAIFCWGMVPGMQFVNWPVPQRVGGNHVYAAISPPCALTTDGDAYCWGDNSVGSLGIGAASNTRVPPTDPVLVSGGLKWKSIATSSGTTCGIATDDVTRCWGSGVRLGIGIDTTTPVGCSKVCRAAPTPVVNSPTFKQLVMGAMLTCGLTADGELFCWGQLTSYPDYQKLYEPTSMGATRFANVASDGNETCAVTADSHTYCFGPGVTASKYMPASLVPVEVAFPVPMRRVASTGATGGCGFGTDARIYCWSTSTIMQGAGELRPTGYGPALWAEDTTATQFSEVAGQR